MRFHDLRHSFAVASLKHGDDVKTVPENIGHATAAFTLDVYGHATDEMKRASGKRMDAAIQQITNTAVYLWSTTWKQKKSPRKLVFPRTFSSLGEKIRTSGLLNPIQARYQTAPHPDTRFSANATIILRRFPSVKAFCSSQESTSIPG